MRLEDMHRLAIGTRICARKCESGTRERIVAKDASGDKYVLWSDGSHTARFGVASEIHECIASYLFCADCELGATIYCPYWE